MSKRSQLEKNTNPLIHRHQVYKQAELTRAFRSQESGQPLGGWQLKEYEQSCCRIFWFLIRVLVIRSKTQQTVHLYIQKKKIAHHTIYCNKSFLKIPINNSKITNLGTYVPI